MIKKEAGRYRWSALSPKESEVASISYIEFNWTISGPVNGAILIAYGEGKICRFIEVYTPYGKFT